MQAAVSQRALKGNSAHSRPGSCGPAKWQGREVRSEFDLLCDAESVIDLDPEIPDGAFELRMSEQQLNRSKVTSLSVDLRRLRPAH